MPPVNLYEKYSIKPVNLIEKYKNKEKSSEEKEQINPKEYFQQGLNDYFGGAKRFSQNLAAGGLEAARGIGNIPHQLHLPNAPEFEPTNFSKMVGIEGEPTLSDKLIQGFAQYAPSLALPGANLGRVGEAVGAIPKSGKFLKDALEQAIPQAGYGATQNENPLVGASEGGIGSIAGSALGTAIQKGINSVRPSQFLRGELSPEQLAKNLESTKGTETGLGRVIENPLLNRIQENVLPHVLGSGAERTMQRNAEKIKETGKKIIEKLNGKKPPENFGISLQESLKKAAQEAREAKNLNYAHLNSLADEAKLKVGRENFQETASKVIGEVKQSKELEQEFGKDLLKSLQRYARNKEGNTLKLTNIFRGKLGDKANELYQSGKMHEYGIVKKLQDSLSKDIESSFENSGKPELKEAYQKSQREYKEKFAPFEDKDIVKFTRQGGDPDLILSYFLKTGANDRGHILDKIVQGIGRKQDIASAYLSKALDEEGNLNPIKLRTLYNKLGQNQRKILFGKGKEHKNIKNYVDLIGKNIESFNLLFNPKTGQRLSTLAQAVTAPAHLGSALGAGILGKLANKALTSPKYREKLVNAMIKNKMYEIPKTKAGLQKGVALVSGLSGNDKEQKPLELEVIGKRR